MIITAVLFFLSTLTSKSQLSIFHLNDQFNSAVEISSLASQRDNILLFAEKCKRLYCLDKSGKLSKTFNLDKGDMQNGEVEIEGMTTYKNGLLLCDEKNAKIYSLDFSDSSISEVKTDYDLSSDIESYGLEGIAVDTANNICYLLKEKDGNNQSVIHVFKIINQGNAIGLNFIKNVFIQQPDNSCRYSDLFFNHKDNYLYCLKTKSGSYQVDTVSTAHISIPGDKIIKLNTPKLFKDISEDVNQFSALEYNTNMEGVTIADNIMYVVSDNAQVSASSCNTAGQGKTLLIYYNLTHR